jgi:hypothetical protein
MNIITVGIPYTATIDVSPTVEHMNILEGPDLTNRSRYAIDQERIVISTKITALNSLPVSVNPARRRSFKPFSGKSG